MTPSNEPESSALDSDSDELLAGLVDEAERRFAEHGELDVEAFASSYPKHEEELKELLQMVLSLRIPGDNAASVREDMALGTFGPFTLLRQLGRGGMGVVHLASDSRLGRTVALKRLHGSAIRNRTFFERFQRESRATARLNHPHIVSLFDAGEVEGVPYYTMQFVEGSTLAEILEDPDYALTFQGCAELASQLASGVAHAHESGILHRDIKPANIIVDEMGQPSILDFGICQLDEDVDLTQDSFVGTLRYCAPEQLDGVFDERSDVYALGLVLYELLARRRAFESESRAGLLRSIAHEEPRRPTRIDRSVPRDLETIARKAYAKLPEERYQTAQAMARDLRAFASGRPIAARPPSALYLAQLFASRHRGVCVAAILALGALTLLGVRYVTDIRSSESAKRAETHLARLAAAHASLAHGEAARALHHLNEAPKELPGWEWRHLYARADQSVQQLGLLNGASLHISEVAVDDTGSRMLVAGGAGAAIWDLSTQSWSPPITTESVKMGRWSHDGSTVAIITEGRLVLRYDAATLTRDEASPALDGFPTAMALDANGDILIGTLLGDVWRFPAGGHEPEFAGAVPGRVAWIEAEQPNRWRAMTVHGDLFEATGNVPSTSPSVCLGVETDSLHILSTDARLTKDAGTAWMVDSAGGIRSVDLGSGRVRLYGETTGCRYTAAVPIEPDHTIAAFGRGQNFVYLHRTDTGAVQGKLSGHSAHILSADWSQRHSLLVTGDVEGELRAWDPRFRGGELILRGHENDVWAIAIASDGRRVATAGRDGLIIVWDVDRVEPLRVFDDPGRPIHDLTFDRRSESLYACCWDGRLYRFDLERGVLAESPALETGAVMACAITDDLIAVGTEGALHWLDHELEPRTPVPASPIDVAALELHSDGDALVVSGDGTVRRIARGTFHERWVSPEVARPATALAYDPESNRMAIIVGDTRVVMLDAATGESVAKYSISARTRVEDKLVKVAIGPEPGQVTAGSTGGSLYMWRSGREDPIIDLAAHTGYVTAVAIDKARQQIFTGSSDRSVRVWHDRSSAQLREAFLESTIIGEVSLAEEHRDRLSLPSKLERAWDGLTSEDEDRGRSARMLAAGLSRAEIRVAPMELSVTALTCAISCLDHPSEGSWRHLEWCLQQMSPQDPHYAQVAELLLSR